MKRIFLKALDTMGGFRLFNPFTRNSAVVFMLHSISEKEDGPESISTRHLEEYFRYLKDHAYDVIPLKRYVRALAKGMQYILDHPEETVQMVASFPDQVEKADKLAWRWKIQNPLFTSEDTKKNGLLWMNPAVWEEMMAFYKEYEQIPRVVPPDEMMSNGFNPGIKR